jgi:hypothetical protein
MDFFTTSEGRLGSPIGYFILIGSACLALGQWPQ